MSWSISSHVQSPVEGPGFRGVLAAAGAAACGVFLAFVLLLQGPGGAALFQARPTAAAGELQPGFLSGDFSTDARGGANYSIPLEVPPGTAELQPELSLLYNSHAQDGALGMGWNLFGVSSIERCQPPFLQEGKVGGVRYDASDSFCLDGVLLVKVGTSAEGAVYRTEKEGWTRVTARGSAGSGPASFLARSKEGTTIELGGTADSRILAVGRSDVRAWAVNRITDRNGNSIELGFLNSPEGSGAFYPSEIRYTARAGEAPLRKLELEYEARPDRATRYFAGSPLFQNRRLRAIRTLLSQNGQMQLVRRYELQYEVGAATGRSRLARVTELDAAGNHHPPTVFGWQEGSLSLDAARSLSGFGGEDYSCVWADLDGNGRDDLLCDQKKAPWSHYALLSRGNTVSQPILLASFGREKAEFTWADFNGDGRADLLVDENDPTSGRYGHWVLLSKGEGLDPARVLRSFGKPGGEPGWSDFDGDGRADLVYGLTGADHSQWVLLSNGQDLAPEIALGAMGTEQGSFHWLDFNADGKQDLVFDEAAAPFRHWVRLSTGRGLAAKTDLGGFACDSGSFHWADWNGDRLPDLVCSQKTSGSGGYSHRVRPSNGRTLEAAVNLGNHGAGQASFAWLDFNLDGMVDLTWAEPRAGGGATQWVSLSTGTGLKSGLNLGAVASGAGTFAWTDVNGDGLPDFVFDRGTAARPDRQIRFHAGKVPDLLTSATNGLGSTVAVTYRPLSDETAYKSTGTGYPLRNLQTSLYVVAEHSTNDGRANPKTYHFSFEYAGSRLDNRGRGWLGFSRITATDRQTGTRNVTEYLQEFPFTGLTASTEASAIAGLRLSRHENTYAKGETAPGVWQVLRTREKLVQFGRSTRSYAVEKEMAFDPYGNLTLLWDRGDPTDPADDFYQCSTYSNDPSAWLLGFLTETVTTDKASAGANGACAVQGAKLAWSRREYSGGARMDLAFERAWDDTNNSWLTTAYEYDAYGNVVAAATPAAARTTYVFDKTYHTFPEERIDALGHRERSRFDPRFGAVVERTDMNGNVQSTTLDGFGQPVESWGPDPSGRRTRLSRHLRIFTKPIGQGGEFYNETRTRASWAGEDEALWPWERDYIDGLSRTYKTLRGAPGEKEIQVDWRFDDEARASHESQPYFAGSEVLWSRLTYDEHGRLRGVTAPSRTETTMEHDVVERNGRTVNRTVETVTGPDGGRLVTTSWLDARGNLLERAYTAPAGAAQPPAARYRYDRLSRPVEVTAPTGVRTEMEYDSLSRVKRSTNTDGGTTTYTYLPERGLLASRKDCDGGEVAFTYDALGRETARRLSDGQVLTFEYDQAAGAWFKNTVGHLVRATSTRNGVLEWRNEYTYDRYDRTTGNRVTIEGGRTFTMTSEVGASGLPLSFTYPDGSVLQSRFSGLGFLASLQFTGEDKPYLRYENHTALGQPQKATYKNGVVSTYDYLPDGRLRHTATGLGATAYLDRTLTWNALDAVTRIDDKLDPGRSQTFQYDAQGYLTQASSPSGYGQRSYQYDAAGNLERKDGVTYEYVRDQVRRGTRDGKEVFKAGYDCLGRMTSQERDGRTWTYRYNPEGQLLSATSSKGESYSYAYDYLGRRTKKKSADGTTTYYLYDDYEVTVLPGGGEQHTKYVEGLAGHVASITRSGAQVQAALAALEAQKGWRVPVPAVLAVLAVLFLLAFPAAVRWRARRRTATVYARRNPWKAALVPAVVFALLLPLGAPALAAPAPVAAARAPGIPQPGVLFFHQDHLNSTSLLTDEKGAVSARVDYLPYGEVFQLTGKDDFRAKFSARELDEASGFYYFNARYYDPLTGRFTTADTVLVGGPDQSAAALNLYAYTGNNPISYTDPSGNDFGASAIIAAIVIVALGVTAGVYAGGAAVNHNLNPAQWDWQSPKTIVGMIVGGAIGGIGAAVDVAAVAALGPVAGGIVGGAIAGVFEGASFSALGGGSPQQIAEDALVGGILGVAFTAIGASVGRAAARTRAPASSASRGVEQVAKVETRLARRLNVAADVCRCFSEDTEVATGEGDVAIGTIQPGDTVWAFDEATGQVELQPVAGVFERIAGEILLVTVDGEVMEATPGHPVWVEGRGWTDAAELTPGDRLVDREGDPLMVERVERRQGRFRVFNLEVEGSHTFYASSRGALVHNCDGIAKLVGVVLGESMSTRVIPVAKEMGLRVFKPRGKNPNFWKRNQRQWIYRQIKSGREIYDIGPDPTRSVRSEYYEIEQKMLKKYGLSKFYVKDVQAVVDPQKGTKQIFPVDEWRQ